MLKKGAQLDGLVGLALLESECEAPVAGRFVAVDIRRDDVDVGGEHLRGRKRRAVARDAMIAAATAKGRTSGASRMSPTALIVAI